ncbi:hypothetical protein C0075_21725 [Rhizobium sp. KAs_5_22]|uniref:hypothetical protein n=1 Tax=Ciceribacter selenitireducens TaxID=448181 RepID=UPI000491608C|nr:hypothetical protein [Ciceribacter selenitireducens]PPJ48116.1 hypothetical protein C0075_21725 [Rhizobium sp. KAs_5_22]
MSDKVLKNAVARKKSLIDRRLALHDEITQIDQQIGEVESFIKTWHMFSEQEGDELLLSAAEKQNKDETTESPNNRIVSNSRKEDVAEASREIIRRSGHPLRREELYEALIAKGLTINGKDPLNVLTTMLWRMQHRVAKRPDGRYDLAENQGEGADPASATADIDDMLG